MQVKLETDMLQQTGSKLGKEYVKAVYHHPACLTSMQKRWTGRNAGCSLGKMCLTHSGKICMQVRKQQLDLDMEQQTDSK